VALNWILGKTEADLTPNLKEVTPQGEPPMELEFRKDKKKDSATKQAK